MAPLQDSCLKKVLFLYLILLLFITSSLTSAYQPKGYNLSTRTRRALLEIEDDIEENHEPIIKKKPTSSSTKIPSKNQTKLIKPTSNSSKNQTKLIKTTTNSGAFKNQTKPIKLKLSSDLSSSQNTNKTKPIKSSSSTEHPAPSTTKSQLKKLNSTSNSTTKGVSLFTKKSSDLSKITSSKNKTTKPTTSKETKAQLEKATITQPKSNKAQKQPNWINDEDDDDDLVAEFRELPSKFQETFVPDLEKISKTSQIYLTKYNKEFTKGFKPYVGHKYASTIASFVSFAFIIIPLILVSLIFNKIKAYFSLQKLLIFIQIYLAIYFTILCLSSLATGLEPLRFFYSTSQSTYVCVQVMQTLGYVLYLLLLLMYLILVFSTESGLATKMLGLGQTFVGFAVGLHYYMTVFHRAVLHQPPKSSWKVHGLYATCFLVICLLGRVDRRKKAYLVEGGEEGKKS